MDEPRLIFVMIADIEPAAVAAFQRYEAAVLPLLDRHDGRLERRLRSSEGTTEIHVVSFAARSGYDSYMADPERTAHREILPPGAVTQRLLEAHDVAD